MAVSNNREPRSLLVTGANGFVGQALCRHLLAKGFIVRGAVRNVAEVAPLLPGVDLVPIATIGSATDWSEALHGIDAVVHLAARVHVMEKTTSNPLPLYREVNVAGTERLARMAAAVGVTRFVFVSSVKVMGEESAAPYSEEMKPSPLDPYGVSKWEAEQVLLTIAEETGLDFVILRPPLIYGPGVKANFHRLLGIVNRGLPLPLASIDNRRSLLFVGNLVDAIATVLVRPEAPGRTYFVSDGEDVSTPELVRRIAHGFGVTARLLPFPPALIRLAGTITGKTAAVDRLLGSLVVSSERIRHELGWKPPFTNREGLEQTAQWYKNEVDLLAR